MWTIQRWFYLYFGLLFVLYAGAPDYIDVNQWARYDLTKSIVNDHTFAIDRYAANTMDWAKKDNHFYSNKAPGGSFLAVPIYWVISTVEKALELNIDDHPLDKKNMMIVDWFITALPSVFLAYFLFLFLSQQVSTRNAWILSFGYSIGTIAFAYSTMWWGHQTAAAFLFFAFYSLVRLKRPATSGLWFGLAVLTEYSVFLTAPAFICWIWYRHRPRLTSLTQFVLGGLPSAILLGLYHQICFGSPLSTAFKYSNPIFLDNTLWLGLFNWPVPEAIYSVTFSRQRGLFLISPFLVFTFMGFFYWIKNQSKRAEAFFSLWIVFVFFIFGVTFFGWRGGSCAGPRYLIPLIPYLVLSLAYLPQNYRYFRLFYLTLFFSVFHNLSIVAVDITPLMEVNLLKDKIYLELFRNFSQHLSFVWMAAIAMILFTIASYASNKKDDATA